MEINKSKNNEYNFSDLDEELNDYEGVPGKISGINFDTLDYKESKKENPTEVEKKSGRVTKKRRVLPKVDSEKLVGPDGLTKLKEQGPKLKFKDGKKSKNATIENLRTVVNFYRTWAHALCPQMKFKDVIFQSENICKEKRLKHYLDVWREEAKNKQSETDDYLSGKTLADDEESEFWQTPSQSASRSKRNKIFSSFEDKLKEGSAGQYREESDDDDLTLVNQFHEKLFDAALLDDYDDVTLNVTSL
ncbi:14513_t:CDS:1 [Funneliformis geosporum]|uniref:Chromosome segregation in meiosis protein n=1 Tax=Funneliformis geosporum TaxID=1117311 RepID=A0A9W4SJU5_9GLOM|nr:14513_t:CDS:1 [Funneliformis geosporum]CAI2172550.1 10423_t:CDS:1 [Funneliformis geosporum]